MKEDLQNYVNQLIAEQNRQAIKDFEGYSPVEMMNIFYQPFVDESPIKVLAVEKADYERIPLFVLVRFLARLVADQGELKLTQKGHLPMKVVEQLHTQKLGMEGYQKVVPKRMKESDSVYASLAHFMLHLTGIGKKRHNKLSLTKTGEKLYQEEDKLFRAILEAFCMRFNWPYFDFYQDERIGQAGFGFSIILLSKYGDTKQIDQFYAKKYFKAFPQLIDESIKPPFGDIFTYASKTYSLRTFDRFFTFFGLAEVEQEKLLADKFVKKSTLFDKLIKVEPPTGSKEK